MHGGQFGIMGKVVNVPVEVDQMVQWLPRVVSNDMGIFVNLKKTKVLKSVYVSGLVRKAELKPWLDNLCSSPPYIRYHILMPKGATDQCLNDRTNTDEMETAEGLEDDAATIDDPVCANRLLTLQRETVMWDNTTYLDISPGENIVPQSLLYDKHAEELSFPEICF